MSLLLNKSKIILFLGLLLFLPALTQATTCGEAGGTCMDASSCTNIQGGCDEPCGNGKVCCADQTYAEEYEEGLSGGFLFLKGHIVPCGRLSDDPGTTDLKETDQCTLCHLFLMLKNIFDLMLSLVIITAILLITIGGVIYIVSAGNSKLTGIAKNIINKTLIGFALMIIGWLLVFTLLTFLSTGDMVGKGTDSWFEFTCDKESAFKKTL